MYLKKYKRETYIISLLAMTNAEDKDFMTKYLVYVYKGSYSISCVDSNILKLGVRINLFDLL